MWAEKSPTPFIVCGIVAISCLFIGLIIPNLLHNILQDEMKEFAILSRYSFINLRNNYDLWSAIPGKNNFTYKKQVTLYKIKTINDNEVQLVTGPKLNYTIDRNISWTELIDSV